MNRLMISLIAVLVLLISSQLTAENSRNRVITVEDLRSISTLSKERNLPVMMFFASDTCEFCDRLEKDYLAGMSSNSDYVDKVIIRRILIDGYDDIYDFNGDKISAEDFSANLNVSVTPTLLMLDHNGNPIAKKLVGYQSSGFFGLYLDEIIEQATQRLN